MRKFLVVFALLISAIANASGPIEVLEERHPIKSHLIEKPALLTPGRKVIDSEELRRKYINKILPCILGTDTYRKGVRKLVNDLSDEQLKKRMPIIAEIIEKHTAVFEKLNEGDSIINRLKAVFDLVGGNDKGTTLVNRMDPYLKENRNMLIDFASTQEVILFYSDVIRNLAPNVKKLPLNGCWFLPLYEINKNKNLDIFANAVACSHLEEIHFDQMDINSNPHMWLNFLEKLNHASSLKQVNMGRPRNPLTQETIEAFVGMVPEAPYPFQLILPANEFDETLKSQLRVRLGEDKISFQ